LRLAHRFLEQGDGLWRLLQGCANHLADFWGAPTIMQMNSVRSLNAMVLGAPIRAQSPA
jgi:hypothetical protein